ncbi:MAG: molybdopterin dinucleotide binding domain-containing protein, partial [Pseudomonas sp.]
PAALAALVGPAASWGEKEGRVSTCERRVSHVRQAIAPPGEARPDWAITVDFAQRLERRLRPQKTGLFAFETPAQVFDEYKQLTRGQDLDLSGLSHALLDRIGPQQWPFPAKAQAGTPRLYTDGVFPTASGRAQFVADPYRAAKEQRDARFPLTLITGRLRDQWHGMSRTGTAAQLFGHVSEASLSLHPDELRRHRFKEGDLVNLKSRRGKVIVAVTSDDSVRPGQAFLPMHWGDRFLKGGVNTLTQPAFDPLSKQPELKHSGVRLEAVQLPWHLFALIEGDVQQHFEALRPLCEQFAYVSLSLTGRERPALLVRAAHTEAPDLQLLNSIDRLLGLNDGPVMAYDDPRRSIGKRVRIEKGRITAIRLAGETLARYWLQSLWLEGRADEQLRRWLLAPLSAPPGGGTTSNRILCNCKNVSESAICAGIGRGLNLDGLKQALGCGTQCGSCVPEIKRLLASTSQPIAISV